MAEEILANLRSYIIVGKDSKTHRDSRKATVYVNPFFRIPQELLPPHAMTIYRTAKENGFEIEKLAAYITNLSKFEEPSHNPQKSLSLHWMSEGFGINKSLGNNGFLNLSANFYSLPFTENDLDYARLSKEVSNEFDLYKLIEKAKWKTVLGFGLGRQLNDSIMPDKQKQPRTLEENLFFSYNFTPQEIFEGISGSLVNRSPNSSFVGDINEAIEGVKDNSETPSSAPARQPKAWKVEEIGQHITDYNQIVCKYFPGITEIKEDNLKTIPLKQIINEILPKLIHEGEKFVVD